MQPKEFVALTHQALTDIADPKKAHEMKAYMRNQFEFLGVPTPSRRLACHFLVKSQIGSEDLIQTVQLLWLKPEREYRYVACDLLVRNAQRLSSHKLPFIRKLMQKDSWWDTVDSLSGVVGDIVLLNTLEGGTAQHIMDTWLTDANFWVRRCAMIHQLGWRMQTDTDRLRHYALTLAHENEFFIRKAIGWACRDYAKWNPDFVRALMQANRAAFSNLSYREATKNL